jgi:hypothetical protein
MLRVVLAIVALAGLTGVLVVGGQVGRWLAVRALGVRGVPFPFGAVTRWCWTSASALPQALGFVGSLLGMYVVSGTMIALGTQITGRDVPETAASCESR